MKADGKIQGGHLLAKAIKENGINYGAGWCPYSGIFQ